MITAEEKLSALRKVMADKNIESFLVTINDEFLLEQPLLYNNRLKWLTGFLGSFATLLITKERAYFFTDSRYLIQAKIEIPTIYTLLKFSASEIACVIKDNNIQKIAYDSRMLTKAMLKPFICELVPLKENLIDLLWDRETHTVGKIMAQPFCYAGLNSKEKCQKVLSVVGKNNYFFSNSESICWLANIRGSDLEYIPIVFCRAILYVDGLLQIFLHTPVEELPPLEDHIEVLPLRKLEAYLRELESVALDTQNINTYYFDVIGKEKISHLVDPSIIMRACKNPIELNGAIAAHKRDGIALVKFLDWLKLNETSNELEAEEVLLGFRKEQDLFFSSSFAMISAFGAHGAIIHYRASKESNFVFQQGNLYLVDSGAQYLDGTTDVTRTVAIGNPTKEQQFHYTLVLKAHIALAKVIFPVGTTGRQLDALARSHLWQYKLDYDHGTGHGVGSFLNVHEGPHSFGNDIQLQPGMILSNEPGLYFEGKYGIRIENLMYVKEVGDGFFGFAQLTLVPFDEKLISADMLSKEEIQWLSDYSELVAINR